MDGHEPASIVYESDNVIAFMSIQPTRPGECLVIPKIHIDHFTDIDDETISEIILVANRIGRKQREYFNPLRIGMVVHGLGVPHAHLILVPQHDSNDITSGRFANIEDGKIVFDLRNIPRPKREQLDEHAQILKILPETKEK